MDVLSDILSLLRLQGTLYFSTELSRPWGIRVPAFGRVARFHLVVRGRCWVRVCDGEPRELQKGDLILIPHGAEHILSDEPDRPTLSVDEVVERTGFTGHGALVYGGEDDGSPTRLVCGHFAFDEDLTHPLVSQLPAAVQVQWDTHVLGSPLEEVFEFIAHEALEARPGYEAVVKRLSEVLFVQIIRHWHERTKDDPAFVAGLQDPQVAAALTAIHEDPAAPWTVESLGREAAMSRTAFAERFREVVGETPHDYLTRWRMLRARHLLRESDRSLDRIARLVGYESGPSFSRAFKKRVGLPPGAYRKTARS